MKDLQAICRAWTEAPAGQNLVLATVIGTTGSVYRRRGARVLLCQEGWLAGSISGGCLEADLIKTAFDRTANGSVIATFDASSPDDIWFGFGLGCQGTVQVLMEPYVKPSQEGGLQALEGSMPLLIDVWKSGKSSRLVCLQKGHGQVEVGFAETVLNRDQGEVLYEEMVGPPLSLVIYGAGKDAIPLAEIGYALGWTTTIVDARPAYANRANFPKADRIVTTSWQEEIYQERLSAAVIMTHSFENDRRVLDAICNQDLIYLGILGPKSRAKKLLESIGNDNLENKIHAPVGLNLGAETPAEIAVSIISEILALTSGASVFSLRESDSPIHDVSRKD